MRTRLLHDFQPSSWRGCGSCGHYEDRSRRHIRIKAARNVLFVDPLYMWYGSHLYNTGSRRSVVQKNDHDQGSTALRLTTKLIACLLSKPSLLSLASPLNLPSARYIPARMLPGAQLLASDSGSVTRESPSKNKELLIMTPERYIFPSGRPVHNPHDYCFPTSAVCFNGHSSNRSVRLFHNCNRWTRRRRCLPRSLSSHIARTYLSQS